MEPTLSTIGALAVLAAAWITIVVYSRRHFYWLGCESCDGTGKKFEPLWMAWLCFRRRQAWRDCTACSGKGKRIRR